MNILLVSQCSKNALERTRQILDQFAERRGERTWQTAITQQGLDTLRRLLRQTARKNTAVACHWIRGKDHSELLWIVGDARQFNERGAVPTNLTRRDILRSEDENDWHSAELIRLLAGIAALFHDFGKANAAFQAKLQPGKSRKPQADAFRHEWVSLRLFEAFVAGETDASWLARLAELPESASDDCLQRLVCDGLSSGRIFSPFKTLGVLAQAVGWLIVSHHRLPCPPKKDEIIPSQGLLRLPQGIESRFCGQRPESDKNDIAACWEFKRGLPFASRHWRQHAAKLAVALQQQLARQPLPATPSPYLLHLARLGLMLADHYYSSQDSHPRYGDPVAKTKAIYANTDKTGALKQRLDEHLIGVEVNTSRLIRTLPRLAEQLPRLVHRAFRQRANAAFSWQNRAFELAEGLRERSEQQGFFGVNMASTGCGKTLANGRILYGLAQPRRGARFTIALGLRTLTLQTGDAYRERLHLGDDEMAVMVGGAAVRELHEHQHAQTQTTGSESADALVPEHSPVVFAGSIEDGPLNRWLKQSPDATKLLNAPILACTIDHLMPACESTRGGHQIPPMLRLMSSDLVLDEPDDFGIDDLPALSRLVHWAGLLGSRVLLSSATLPPALIEGLFEAYRAGRAEFAQHRGRPQKSAQICCAWFDEFAAEASDCGEIESYRQAHSTFVEKRLARLDKAPQRRKAEILPLSIARASREQVCADLAQALPAAITRLHHSNHQIDPRSGKRVSIGLIRLANIDPLTLVARQMLTQGAPAGQHLHLCVYHSRHPLLVRSAIEQGLDRLLKRHQPTALFDDPELRQQIDSNPAPDQIFIVLATAVAEVGRDHDYDWAIVEPSSMRSIIQLAGRIRRHRPEAYPQTNLLLLDTNIKHLVEGPGKPAFLRPGFELGDPGFQLRSHRLSELLHPEQLARIDASSRIRERADLQPQDNLVDLEHARLRNLMQGAAQGQRQQEAPAPLWWQTSAHLSGYLQKKQPFRDDPMGRQRYALLPDEDGEIGFYRIEAGPSGGITTVDHLLHPISITPAPDISLWGAPDYASALNRLAEQMHLDPSDCARRYGTLELPCKGFEDGQGIPNEWEYSHSLGFSRKR